MKRKPIKAIIFGATGLVGSAVLLQCMKHSEVESITVISRKSKGIQHEKLKEIIHDNFLDYSGLEDQLKGFNACFYCLGVSQLQVSNEDEYHRITYDFTIAAAEILLRLNPEITFCFLSGSGTDSTEKSRMMWARIKGKAENAISKMNFKKVYHFRPALIFPKDGIKHSTTMTKILWPFYPVLNMLFPAFILNTTQFGLAMINVALYGYERMILENKDIKALGR